MEYVWIIPFLLILVGGYFVLKREVEVIDDWKKTKDEEIAALRIKAAKWDALGDEIAEFYEDYDDDGNEIPPKRDGDLCDIGQVAATHYGWI